MKWDYGKIYKSIRKEKGFTQEEVCGNTISRTTLSKFENCKLTPSYETITFLLSQINLSFEEFEYIVNEYGTSEKTRIINKFFNLVSNLEEKKIDEISKDCEKYLRYEDDVTIREILILSSSLNLLTKDNSTKIEEIPKIFAMSIWDRLSKMDNWYYYEIRLLNCIFYIFPAETILEMVPRMLIALEKYSGFHQIDNIKVSVLINLNTITLQHKLNDLANDILDFSYEYIKASKRIDFLGIWYFRKGLCTQDRKFINRGKSFLELLDDKSILNELEQEQKMYKV